MMRLRDTTTETKTELARKFSPIAVGCNFSSSWAFFREGPLFGCTDRVKHLSIRSNRDFVDHHLRLLPLRWLKIVPKYMGKAVVHSHPSLLCWHVGWLFYILHRSDYNYARVFYPGKTDDDDVDYLVGCYILLNLLAGLFGSFAAHAASGESCGIYMLGCFIRCLIPGHVPR